MKKLLVLFVSLTVMSLAIFAGESKKVEAKDLPKEVVAAAKEKVKDFTAKEATLKEEGDVKEYEVKGSADGKEVKVEVKVKEGKVTEVKVEEAAK